MICIIIIMQLLFIYPFFVVVVTSSSPLVGSFLLKCKTGLGSVHITGIILLIHYSCLTLTDPDHYNPQRLCSQAVWIYPVGFSEKA